MATYVNSISIGEVKQLDESLKALAINYNNLLSMSKQNLRITDVQCTHVVILRGKIAEKVHEDVLVHIRHHMEEKLQRLINAGIRVSVSDYLKNQ